MTISELQTLLMGSNAAISYLGPVTSTKWPYACSISPQAQSKRWRPGEWCMRGKGKTLEEALEDALQQLSIFMVSRLADPRNA